MHVSIFERTQLLQGISRLHLIFRLRQRAHELHVLLVRCGMMSNHELEVNITYIAGLLRRRSGLGMADQYVVGATGPSVTKSVR